MRSRALAVAALLVLAGCGGVGPSPDSGPGPAPTTEPPQYPPGVTEDGLRDADALVAAHRSSVHEDGATTRLRMNITARADDRTGATTVGAETMTVVYDEEWRAAPGLDRVRNAWRQSLVTENGSTRQGQVQLYANESVVVTRNRTTSEWATRTEPRDGSYDELLLAQVAASPLLDRTFEAGNFSVTDVERRNGRTVTTLSVYEGTFTGEGRAVFAATVEVAASGRVLSLSVRRDDDATTAAGERRTNVTWSDGTDVERPEWAP